MSFFLDETIINTGLSKLFSKKGLTSKVDDGILTITGKNDTISLPIQPESYSVSVVTNNSTVNVQSVGDVNMLGKTGLHKISLKSFLPNIDYNFANGVDVDEYIERLEKIRTSGTYCHISIEGTRIDFDVSFDKFDYDESSGVGDLDYTMAFTEYPHLEENDTKPEKHTGLKKRKLTALDKVKANLSYRRGDTPLSFLNRAISKTNGRGLDVDQKKYLSYAKTFVKTARQKDISLAVGDLISLRNQNGSIVAGVHDKEITLKESAVQFNSPQKKG